MNENLKLNKTMRWLLMTYDLSNTKFDKNISSHLGWVLPMNTGMSHTILKN